MNIQQQFRSAVDHCRRGQFAPAEQICRAIVAKDPKQADALHLLGVIAMQTGRPEEAGEWFGRAVAHRPVAEYYLNLGNALKASGKSAEALDAFEAVLRIDPNHAMALNSLGNMLRAMGKLEEAEAKVRRALQLKPNLPQVLFNLGKILTDMIRLEEAADLFRRAIAIDPRAPVSYHALGHVLSLLGRNSEAIEAYRRALALNPNWPEAFNDLSIVLCEVGDLNGAVAAAQESLRLRPGFHVARGCLADALHAKGETDQAISIYAQLVSERPSDDELLNSYANLLLGVGRTEEASAHFHRAAEVCPSNTRAASNYLFALQFHCDDPVVLLEEHRKWDARYAAPLKGKIRPFANDRSPNRRLRIGYVSADFRRNVLALFTSALLPQQDHEQFEIYCYSQVAQPDAVTARLQSHADVWRPIASLSDNAVAEQIRADGIDILMDQTMHMRQNRLLAFARKPAPIQVAWLAYPGTTGLSTMDYRLTDPYLDPPDFDDRYTEKSIRLPETFWCYEPHGMSGDFHEVLPDPGELPAGKNGFFTFGCLNGFHKINAATLQRWGRLMQRVERSRLHLLAPSGQRRKDVLAQLQPFGITSDRVEFINAQPRPAYLAEYRRIDLCLDPLPYNGHTTSLDAFWMGVPVLTQVGRTLVGRAGLSQLINLQLSDFAADDDEQFISLGQRWAGDLSGLAEIRRNLRERMASSPLMDAKKFAGRMEGAFRQMWNQWIAT
jgi:predicted O-linked N-acetylglucosamine transferase (SPINDLY family)